MQQVDNCSIVGADSRLQQPPGAVDEQFTGINSDDELSNTDLNTRIRLLQSKLHPGSLTNIKRPTVNSSPTKHQQQQQQHHCNITSNFKVHRPQSRQSVCSDSRNSTSADEQCCSPEDNRDQEQLRIDEEDSLDSLSSTDSSGNSSLAPTPPPRFSSLIQSQKQQQQQQQKQQHTEQIVKAEAIGAPTSNIWSANGQHQQVWQSSKEGEFSQTVSASSIKLPTSGNSSATSRRDFSSTSASQIKTSIAANKTSPKAVVAGDDKCVPLATHAALLSSAEPQHQTQEHLYRLQHQHERQQLQHHRSSGGYISDGSVAHNFVVGQPTGSSSGVIVGLTPHQQQQQPLPMTDTNNQSSQQFVQRNKPTMPPQALLPHNQLQASQPAHYRHQPPVRPDAQLQVPMKAHHLSTNSNHNLNQQQQQQAQMAMQHQRQHHNANQLTPASKITASRPNIVAQKTSINCAVNHCQQPSSFLQKQPLPPLGQNRYTGAQHQPSGQVLKAGQLQQVSSAGANWDALTSGATPITKAVQEMVNQQQQQQATFVINTPSSRHPIRGPPCSGSLMSVAMQNDHASPPPPLPLPNAISHWSRCKPPAHRPLPHPHALGSVSSASMSSLSSAASSSSRGSNHLAAVRNSPKPLISSNVPAQLQTTLLLTTATQAPTHHLQKAAIEKISSDSVQLLVAANHQQQEKQSQRSQLNPQQQQASSLASSDSLTKHPQDAPTTTAPGGDKQKANDLLMMQAPAIQQQQQQQQTTSGLKHSDTQSQAARAPSQRTSSSSSPSRATLSQKEEKPAQARENNDTATPTALAQVMHSSELSRWPMAGAGVGELSAESAPLSVSMAPDERRPQASPADSSMTLDAKSANQMANTGPLSEASESCATSGEVSCPTGAGDSSVAASADLQRQARTGERVRLVDSPQRQAELLQLMRLRQQQQAISSQELPTLQQLQQQIQEQRAAIAVAAESSARQQQKVESSQPQQQQRMQQWTAAAAAMVQQRQQQQRPEQCRPSNASAANFTAAAAATTTTPTPVSAEMRGIGVDDRELEQTTKSSGRNELQANEEPNLLSRHLQNSQTNYHPAREKERQQRQENEAARQRIGSSEQQDVVGEPRLQSLLTTTTVESGVVNVAMMADNNNSSSIGVKSASGEKMPVPTPRSNNHLQPQTSIQNELSILTNTSGPFCPKPRVKNLNSSLLSSPANSTPPASILSDSTTLITEAAMNSAELIPKLIERLDRKLVVMKEEQLSLMREIELNETMGLRLYDSLKGRLSGLEFEKITMHAEEIEKVTKLILSLKMRLKRVESELKEKTSKAAQEQDQQQLVRMTADEDSIKSPTSEASSFATGGLSNEDLSSAEQFNTSQQQGHKSNLTKSHHFLAPSTVVSRGVSDPTSTTGLPKRSHQHHASLQLETTGSATPPTAQTQVNNRLVSGSSSGGSRSSPICAATSQTSSVPGGDTEDESQSQDQAKKVSNEASSSSDSIFNCGDSAIGSTITEAHGGSATNIEQPTISQSSLTSVSSSSTHSSLADSSNRSSSNYHRRRHLQSNGAHLSSSISVSSSSAHSSMSSVPNSPPLVSPLAATNRQSPAAHKETASPTHQPNSDANNNSNSRGNTSSASTTTVTSGDQSMAHLAISDIDLLLAKRTKLVSQLEEAHQLEDCIADRNKTIVQRILKKYYQDESQGEIAEFKQFCRLRSLLLKDSHDVSDRIDNAELQLTELRKSNREEFSEVATT